MIGDELVIKAKGKSWTLRMVPSAWIELEDAGLGSIQEIGANLQSAMSFRTLRQIMAAALRWKQPELTEEDVAALADELGSEAMLTAVTEVIQASFPKSANAAAGNGTKAAN